VCMKLLALFALLPIVSAFAADVPPGIAIIINKDNKTDTVSTKDLRQIFAGDTVRWPGGVPIQTMATGAATPEHRIAIQFLFGMTEPEYQKYCIHATFVGSSQRVPRDFGTSQAVLRFVGFVPGAIGFIRADAINPSVKVLAIGP